MFYLDNHEEKKIIISETKNALNRIIQGLMFVYGLTNAQSLVLLQDFLYELEEQLKQDAPHLPCHYKLLLAEAEELIADS